jgi:signal transduction histidine kinase
MFDEGGESEYVSRVSVHPRMKRFVRLVTSPARAWTAAPLVLVVVALLGSVLIPARQTVLISRLLHETAETLSPARLLAAQLNAGLAEELALARLPVDSASVEAFRMAADSDDYRMARLAALRPRLDSAPRRGIDTLEARVATWRRESRVLLRSRAVPDIERPVSAVRIAHRAALEAARDLSSILDEHALRRDDRMGQLDRIGLGWNITLVVAALAALAGVGLLTARERRTLAVAQMRVRREAALREAAATFVGAFSVEEAMRCIVAAAIVVFDGRDARVETLAPGVHTAAEAERPDDLVIPLGEPPSSRIVVRPRIGERVTADALSYVGIFGHLASLALEKVRTLEAANAGRERLERVLNSRSRLIRGFSHDVKNPIGAADGYASLLSDGIYGELTPAQRDSVERMRRSIQTALALIRDLHELAAAETGHLTLTIEPVDVRELLRGLVEDYQATARAAGIELRDRVAADATALSTSGMRVRQIVSNLISNAIKYTSGRTVTVSGRVVSTGPAGEKGPWMRIDVTDEGPGIPAEKQDFIFEEFSRIDPEHKSGAGLGLAISRLLARALGGHLTVDSVVGIGSTFSLWLPAVDAAAPVANRPGATERRPRPVTDAAPRSARP